MAAEEWEDEEVQEKFVSAGGQQSNIFIIGLFIITSPGHA